MEKLLLTVEEAAECLSLSRSRVYELMANGGGNCIPSVCIGRSRRVPVEGLREWAQRQYAGQRGEGTAIAPYLRRAA